RRAAQGTLQLHARDRPRGRSALVVRAWLRAATARHRPARSRAARAGRRARSQVVVARRLRLVLDLDDADPLGPGRHLPVDGLADAQPEQSAADRRQHRHPTLLVVGILGIDETYNALRAAFAVLVHDLAVHRDDV